MLTDKLKSRDDGFYRYIGVNFMFGLLDCDRYIGDRYGLIGKSGFCSIHFTVTLARLKNVNHYHFIIDCFTGVPLYLEKFTRFALQYIYIYG